MTDEFDSRIVSTFTGQIAAKLDEAAGIARAAIGLGTQGLAERAFEVLLDVEPLIHDVTALLNAASVVRRRERMG